MNCAILTISDRSSQGSRPDVSGPALAEAMRAAGWMIVAQEVVPDEYNLIRQKLIDWCDGAAPGVILTTGGTGFSARDVTPEATQSILQRSAPGIAEAMRQAGLLKTPHAMLSRGVAGIRSQTLIVNLPGSPRAAIENLAVIIAVLPHAVELLHNDPGAEQGHTFQGKPGE